MKTHLFASAVAAALLGITAPAHSQILGGAARGAVGGAFGTGFGPGANGLRGNVDGNASERFGAHVNSDRAERLAKDETRTAARGGESRAAAASEAARREALTGVARAAAAAGQVNNTASAAPATSAETAGRGSGQDEMQTRTPEPALGGSLGDGGHSVAGAIDAQTSAGHASPASHPGTRSTSSRPEPAGGNSGREPDRNARPAAVNAQGEMSASASAGGPAVQ